MKAGFMRQDIGCGMNQMILGLSLLMQEHLMGWLHGLLQGDVMKEMKLLLEQKMIHLV